MPSTSVNTSNTIPDNRHAVLLDLSLFLLDLLDPDEISKKSNREDLILEVPGALATMLWSARGGSTLLYNFIYAHFRGIQNNERHILSSDQRISEIVHSTDSQLHEKTKVAYERLLEIFAPLIDGINPASTSAQADINNGTRKISIRRYEAEYKATETELETLRASYTNRFGILPDPVYDLYFLQIYHAQKIGFEASPRLFRDLVSLGRKTVEILASLTGISEILDINSPSSQRYKEFFGEFISGYIKEEWKSAVFNYGIELAISYIIPNSPNFGISLLVAGVAAATKLPHTEKAKQLLTPLERFLLTIVIMAFTLICFGLIYIRPLIRSFRPVLSPTLSLLATVPTTPTIANTNSSSPSSTKEPPAIAANETANPFQETSYINSTDQYGYCLYVIQPGDTIQSVISRYNISENDLRLNNVLVARGIFTPNQTIKINKSCCSPINNQGISYIVQPGETLYSIAKGHSTSIDTITKINSIYNPRYIQAGQMLCIPYK